MIETSINKILRADSRGCARGTPMGSPDYVAEPLQGKMPPLRCQRVYLVDYDYGPDGTYWGASAKAGHIYCAFNDGSDSNGYLPAMGVRIYVRAFTYEQAKRVVAGRYPDAKFLRGGR